MSKRITRGGFWDKDKPSTVTGPLAHTLAMAMMGKSEGDSSLQKKAPANDSTGVTIPGEWPPAPEPLAPQPTGKGSLNMRDMLTGDVNRLRYITRHSTSLTLHKENVAEHSYYVALYAMFICRWVKVECPQYERIDELTVLHRCLMHDLDESRTGDFQRPFKHRSPELKEAIEVASREEFNEAICNVFPEDMDYASYLDHIWVNAKNASVEGRIVALADYLSVVSYLNGEVRNANRSIMHHYETLMEYGKSFDAPSYDFIRPLIEETHALVNEMLAEAGYKPAA